MFEAALTWLVKRVDLATLAAVAMLAAALGSVAAGLTSLVRGLDLVLLVSVAGVAMIGGWLSVQLQFRVWQRLSAALMIGGLVGLLAVGGLSGQLLDVSWQVSGLSLRLLSWPRSPFDPALAFEAVVRLALPLNTLLVRLSDWLTALINRQPAFDPVAAALAWAYAIWLMAWWAGAWLRGRRPFIALFPALSWLTVLIAYGNGSALYLLLPLASLFLLLTFSGQQERESQWLAKRVDFSEAIRTDLGITALVLSLILIAGARVVPEISIREVSEWLRTFTTRSEAASNNPLPDSLGIKPPVGGLSAFDPLRSPGLPRQHLIGSGPELSQRVVMRVTVAGFQGQETLEPAGEGQAHSETPRFYWRNATYNLYTGRGWVTTQTDTSSYRANVRLIETALPGQQLVQLSVAAVQPLGELLYYAGTLVTANPDFDVAWRSDGDMFSASIPTSYRAESLVSNPTVAQLRSAPAIYPEPIVFRYLALPDGLTPRVARLARELTATAFTPYDRAKALEDYLRQYPYTLDLPAPPLNVDIVDYFLFDLKRGYCDYYASSLAVLARAAGLPARLVTGYASGTFDATTGQFVVTEADAHSWVEIYFAGYGWVEFEPTGGQPAIERPNEARPGPETTTSLPLQPQVSVVENLTSWPALLGALLALLAALPAWQFLDRLRLSRLSPAQTIALLFSRLTAQARHLSVIRTEGDTPYEFARALDIQLDRRRAPITVSSQAQRLIDLYVQSAYSQHRPGRPEQRLALTLWEYLQWQLWLIRVLRNRG